MTKKKEAYINVTPDVNEGGRFAIHDPKRPKETLLDLLGIFDLGRDEAIQVLEDTIAAIKTRKDDDDELKGDIGELYSLPIEPVEEYQKALRELTDGTGSYADMLVKLLSKLDANPRDTLAVYRPDDMFPVRMLNGKLMLLGIPMELSGNSDAIQHAFISTVIEMFNLRQRQSSMH